MKSSVFFVIIFFSLCTGLVLGRALPSLNVSAPVIDDVQMNNHQDHGSIEVGGEEKIPEITLEAYLREDNSVDLKAEVVNFVFTPEEVDLPHRFGFGHGHLYVNQQKSIRLYDEWINVPSHLLLRGANTICVTLSTNNHAHYTVDSASIESCTTVMN